MKIHFQMVVLEQDKSPLLRALQIEEKVHFGQCSSIFFLYVENKKLSETPKYQCF